MELQELLMTALRASVIYVFLLLVVRILGKRTVGNFSAFDLIVALILGEVVDEPIYGDVPMAQAMVAIAVIAAWHFGNSYLSARSTAFDRLTGGTPRVLVRDGKIDREAMAREHMNEEELWSLLRQEQIDDLSEVKEARLESNGKLSVIKTEEAKEVQKRDLKRLDRRLERGA